MIPALPGILTTKQKKSRPGSPSWAAAYFHISIIPSILKHRQDGDDNKTPVAGGRPQAAGGRPQAAKKYTACGLVRRGRPKGGPL